MIHSMKWGVYEYAQFGYLSFSFTFLYVFVCVCVLDLGLENGARSSEGGRDG